VSRETEGRPLAENRPSDDARGGNVGASITAEDRQALDVARAMAAAGIPVFVAYPDPGNPIGYRLSKSWQTTSANPAYVNAWKPGMALCAVMGHGLDLVDVDPRNGGQLPALDGILPGVIGEAESPSGGTHLFVPSMGVRSRDGVLPGIDVKAGDHDGQGRGFAFIAPTVRKSKVTGQPGAYRWTRPPDLARLDTGDDPGLLSPLADLVRQAHGTRKTTASEALFQQPATRGQLGVPVAPGGRHGALISYAGWLLKLGVPLAEAEVLILARFRDLEQPPGNAPYTEDDARAKLHDVYDRYEAGAPAETGELSRAGQLRAALLDSAGLDSLPVPDPLIDGLVYRDSLCWLHGKPGHCKSFVALDWACCVAAGLPWLGRPVTQGPVLYVIAEGTSGLHARVRAWEDRAREQTTVRFLPVAIQMLRLGDVDALATLATEMKYALIVIDTQARVTLGAEENSAVDMGRLVDAAERIRIASGACVMFVHHEARAGDNMRGSTALEGAATTILRVEKDGQRLQLTNPKQKDAAEADPITLWVVPRLRSVVIAGKPDTPTLEPQTASETKILGVLLESFGSTGASATTLRNATGLAESTFHWALNRLVKDGKLVNYGTKTRTCYGVPQAQLPSGTPTTPTNSNSNDSNSNPPIGVAIGDGGAAPLELPAGCLGPGCPTPPRHGCATCWNHAYLEANR
jgi:hypothetical protein